MRPRLGGLPSLADRATRLGGLPHLSCKHDQIKMRDYMERRVTPARRVTSPTWGPPPPCKQALNQARVNHYTVDNVRFIRWIALSSLRTTGASTVSDQIPMIQIPFHSQTLEQSTVKTRLVQFQSATLPCCWSSFNPSSLCNSKLLVAHLCVSIFFYWDCDFLLSLFFNHYDSYLYTSTSR